MPALVWLYLTALVYYRTSGSCVAVAEALETVSHDRLTRMLQGNWSGQTLLDLAVRTLFTWKRGYLIIDDTVIPKPFATAMEGLAWVFSSQEHKPIYGFSLVLLVWTNGTFRIPLGLRLWHKGGPSKYVLALELLSYARNRLRCHPEYVLFDAWFPRKPSSSVSGITGGISSAASKRIAGSMAMRSVTIGTIPTGLSAVG